MPDPKITTAAPKPTAPRSALRVVLFGMPDAGKSSLLGALGQAAQTQEHVLNGHLTDLGRGLADMQRRLYDEAGRSTAEEVIPFPVAFQPFSGKQRLDAVLIDCDGRVANDLLSRKRELEGKAGGELGQATARRMPSSSLSMSPRDADRCRPDNVLASAGWRSARASRGSRRPAGISRAHEVRLLARPGDDQAGWVVKVEERSRDVGKRFQTLSGSAARALPFGSIQLNAWAI